MTEPRTIHLLSGQHADIVASGAVPSALRCISGRAHIALSRMGVGWAMHAGDGCLLRTQARYRVTAQTTLQLTIHPLQ